MSAFLDRAVFGAIVSSHEVSVFNLCARVVGSREAATAATKEAFLALFREPLGMQTESERFPQLLALARDESAALSADPVREAPPADSPFPVRGSNGRLPVRHREVLALRDFVGCSYEEIAAIVGTERRAVAELLWRARLELRDELKGSRLASIAAVADPCRRALPLIAMNWDGEETDPEERSWLQSHLRTCGKCRSSQEAMREASTSYRAWPPAPVPLGMRESLTASAEAMLAGAPAGRPAAGS
jgi:DNA-directed RNA polymerase specialized sigma24 family protein